MTYKLWDIEARDLMRELEDAADEIDLADAPDELRPVLDRARDALRAALNWVEEVASEATDAAIDAEETAEAPARELETLRTQALDAATTDPRDRAWDLVATLDAALDRVRA